MNILVPQEVIENKIFIIRGQKVMIDRDLAQLYGVKPKVLNQAVKRNIARFPDDFMFQLTLDETERSRSQFVTLKRGSKEDQNLRSQIVTSSWGGRRYLPYAFTEQGVAMLSSVLNSERAIQVNIQIMRTFTKLKKMILSNKDLELKVEQLMKKYDKHDQELQAIFSVIKNWIIEQDKPKRRIGFRG